MSTWQLQEAKNRLSEVVERALHEGPQTVTKRGKEAVVIVSADTFKRLSQKRSKPKYNSLAEMLLNSPLRGSGLVIKRAKDLPRKIDL